MAEQPEKKFIKADSKTYQIFIEGKWQTIDVPYGKVELLIREFAAGGGLIDSETGKVKTDLVSIVTSFRSIGDVLLSTYNEKGELVEPRYAANLPYEDVPTLSMAAVEIIENFIQVVSGMTPAKNESKKQEGK